MRADFDVEHLARARSPVGEDGLFGLRAPLRLAPRRGVVQVARAFRDVPERVFAAWLDADSAGQWLFATASHPIAEVTIDPRVGGEFRFVERRGGIFEHVGRYLDIAPPRRLAFTLSMEGRPRLVTRVAIDIVPRPAGCRLLLSQNNVPLAVLERTEGRWTGILYGLAQMLDAKAFPLQQTRSKP